MALIGRALLILGLLTAVYGVGASLYGARTGRREWVDSGRRSVYALAGLMTVAFALLEAVFLANPFATSANPPVQGSGLDPLLLHSSMMIHPPMLYSGYTLLTVPFAFAVGALVTGKLGSEWITVTRRFALAAWLFLGIGI